MSDEEKNQGNQQPAKGSQAEAENRPNTQPHSAETPQTFDGLPSMRAYDTAYPPLNQYSSTLLLLLKPIQPLNPRQTSAWLSVPSAATPAPPSSLNHIMVMGGSGSQIPSTGPGLPHNNYSYGMGGRYGTPGASESASGHGYGENNQAPMHASTSTVADTQQGGKNSSGAERARLRVNKACERCRNHKIKCSGVKPCTNCEKHSVECVFRDASQPANPSSSKANAAMSSSSIASNDGQLFNGESSPKKLYEYPPRKNRTSTTFRLPKTLKLARKPRFATTSVPHYRRLDAYKIIESPIASETAIKKVEDGNTLVFQVSIKANKHQIKSAVKELYNVDVEKINTLVRPNGTKKAYIRLTADHDALDVANRIGYV